MITAAIRSSSRKLRERLPNGDGGGGGGGGGDLPSSRAPASPRRCLAECRRVNGMEWRVGAECEECLRLRKDNAFGSCARRLRLGSERASGEQGKQDYQGVCPCLAAMRMSKPHASTEAAHARNRAAATKYTAEQLLSAGLQDAAAGGVRRCRPREAQMCAPWLQSRTAHLPACHDPSVPAV